MRDGWELNVMRVNGTMYFEEHLSTEKLKEKYVPSSTSPLPQFIFHQK